MMARTPLPCHPVSHLLRAGPLVVEVVPECGGSLARFDCAGVAVLRAGAGPDPRDTACFPLVPFSNRIRDGRLPAPRGEVMLAPLPGLGPHPIHGLAWRAAWAVEAASDTALDLVHAHAADAHWPFDYRARQLLHLDSDALAVTLALTNAGNTAMPAGIGLHPYFPATAGATLTAVVAELWRADTDLLPTHCEPVPPALDFVQGRALNGTALDNCFGGWSGRATLDWPERGLALDIEADAALRTLVVYTPAGADYFCVEPASHLNNAFQLAAAGVPATGARILAPGETLQATVRFAPRRR
jgi:aldose 1-epimerase